MISPAVVGPILRHVDAIDAALSRRVARKRPWDEPALTSLLCDLLDAETQREENVDHSVEELNRDLQQIDGLVRVDFSIDTHAYTPSWERWVTQADLGIVVRFDDRFTPEKSWSTAWLLQAKRIYPRRRTSAVFDETSRFLAIDPRQHERMTRLAGIVGVPFVCYLLYCIRPSSLDDITRHKLAHFRNTSLSGEIFDYLLGLHLHRELSASDNSLAAGVFVASIDDCPSSLGDVHRKILQNTLPLSWFLISHLDEHWLFSHTRRDPRHPWGPRRRHVRDRADPNDSEAWAEGIVSGDAVAVKKLLDTLDGKSTPAFPVLPKHTITIRIVAGPDEGHQESRIRVE